MDRRAGHEGCGRVRAKPEETSANRSRHGGSVHTTETRTTRRRKAKGTMKLPPDIQFYEDIHLLVYRPRGLVTKATVNNIITVVGELEAMLKEPFNRFSDTVAADVVDLNFEHIIRVSLYRRVFYGNRPPIKSAILATDATLIHYGKVHALLTQGSPIKVRVFQNRSEVAQWLDVPVERLTGEDTDSGTTLSRSIQKRKGTSR